MFRGLIPPPPTSSAAYLDLRAKVESYVYQPPPVPLSALATVLAVGRCAQDVEALLQEREMLLWYRERDDPHAERQISFTERVIDASVADARRMVTNLVFHRLRRLMACVLIQKTMLRLLFAPRPGNVPRISRALIDEGFLVIGNGDSDGES